MNQNKWEVFGQDWAVNLLQQHVSRGGLRHAYLISGPIGIGRRTLALRLAQALNCATPIAPGVPCRTCRTCKQIEAGQHADLMVIKKLPDKKDLGVDQIREVSRFLSLKPYMSPYKVVLVINFEDASPSAQNALLKTPARITPTSITRSGPRSRRGSRRSRTRPRSGAGSSSPSRRPSARRIPAGAAPG